jgi:hypothetical protein
MASDDFESENANLDGIQHASIEGEHFMADFIKKGDKSISLQNIIMQAGYNLAHATQWTDSLNLHLHVQDIHAAEELIEMAEVMVCGSVGGFDAVKVGKKHIYQEPSHWDEKGTWPESGKYDRLFERWLWLFTFYVGGDDKTPFSSGNWRNVGDLKKFYKKK